MAKMAERPFVSRRVEARDRPPVDGDAKAFIICIDRRMEDANIGAAADQMHFRDASLAQFQLQIGPGERAVARFVHPVDVVFMLICLIHLFELPVQLSALRPFNVMRRKQLRFWMVVISRHMFVNGKDNKISTIDKLFRHPYKFFFNRLPRLPACERAMIGDKIDGVVDVNECSLHENPSCVFV